MLLTTKHDPLHPVAPNNNGNAMSMQQSPVSSSETPAPCHFYIMNPFMSASVQYLRIFSAPSVLTS